LGYNPKQPPEGMMNVEEILNRGKEFVNRLSERETELLMNQEEDQSMECENHRMMILKLCGTIGLELDPNHPISSKPKIFKTFICVQYDSNHTE